MPKRLIIYYSLTGTTQRLAEALAAKLDADLVRIECSRYRRGWFTYVRGGYDSIKRRKPPVKLSQKLEADYDLLIVGAPVWAGYPAPPLRSLFSGRYDLPERVAGFLTQGGESPGDKAIPEFEAIVGKPLEAVLDIQESSLDSAISDDTLGEFLRELEVAPD